MKISTFLGCAALALSAPALAGARNDFAAYEGQPVIKVGTGGTKITEHGIDYWTTGEPPRRYQVIGAIEDKRDEFWDGGHAIGSPSIARKVKEAGGDAVIILSEDEAGHGGGFSSTTGGANNSLGWLFGFGMSGGSKTITRMVVIKYLQDEEPSAPAAASPTTSPSSGE